MPALLTIKNIDYHYAESDTFRLHIDEFSVDIGQSVLILGESGSGKSTLLGLIGGVLACQNGQITILNHALHTYAGAQMDRFRGEHIGLIYQTLNLIPWLSVEENILLGVSFSRKRRARLTHAPKDDAYALLERLNLPPAQFAHSQAHALSIGQQQRVAAARALIGKPALLLADEPSSALDDKNAQEFFTLLQDTMDKTRQSLIVVSHDTRITPLFDRVVTMQDINNKRRAI